MINQTCLVCHGKLSFGCKSWHLICKYCGYEKANLQPAINLDSAHQFIDEAARETGLRILRIANFQQILRDIKTQVPKRQGRLLDVGCAHGWFIDISKTDFEVLGIEPDKAVFDATFKRGLPVRFGYFPDVLEEGDKFDVIVFNDVIEHIPDIETVLQHCLHRLNKDGLLVLNLPNSNGIFYQLSKLLCRLKVSLFFDRLWQKNLPSPHLHYFNKNNLRFFLDKHGFDIKVEGNLSSIRLTGLYNRITYTGQYGKITCFVIYLICALLIPLLKIFPTDIVYAIASPKQ